MSNRSWDLEKESTDSGSIKVETKSDVKEIDCMMTYTSCNIEIVTPEMTSKERLTHGTEDYLTFIRVDRELNEI